MGTSRMPASRSAKKRTKLKILDIRNVENDDSFRVQARFRATYTWREDNEIIQYFLNNGGYKARGGTTVWKKMVEENVCPGRTWQSLKNRFLVTVACKLHTYDVTEDDLEKADEASQMLDANVSGRSSVSDGNHSRGRGYKNNANRYTRAEDCKILRYIIDNKRYGDVAGVSLWQTMATRDLLPDRTWESMKERFRKTIMENLDNYELTEEQKKFLRTRKPANQLQRRMKQ